MRKNVSDLFQRDADRRWKIISRSIISVFCVSAILLRIDATLLQMQITATALGVCIYFGQVYVYSQSQVTKKERGQKRRRGNAAYRFELKPLLLFPVAMAAMVILLLESPRVQARVLSSRLESITEAPASQKNAFEAIKVLSLAKRSNITLSSDLVSEAVNKVGQSETDISAITNSGKTVKEQDWSIFLTEANRELRGTSIVFVDVGSNKDLSSTTQPLSGISFKDVVWENGILSYQGGYLNLDGMTFKNVIIAVSDNEDARKFVNAVVTYRGKAVIINVP